jgi:hypothetical protein
MKILFFLISLAIITSCTIEKRLYNKGYHIEWYKKHKLKGTDKTNVATVTKHIHLVEKTESQPLLTDNLKVEDEVLDFATISNVGEILTYDNPKLKEPQPLVERNAVTVISEKKIQDTLQETVQPKRDGLAITSLILGLIGLSVLAIIFGLIQLNRIKKNPDVYTGKGMATAGVLLGFGWLVFCSLFFLPFQIGVSALLVISILFALYGMIVLIRSENVESLGIVGTIFGWIGIMAAIFLMVDY